MATIPSADRFQAQPIWEMSVKATLMNAKKMAIGSQFQHPSTGAIFSHAGLAFFAAILFSTSHLTAAPIAGPIAGVIATSNMGSGFGTSLANTVNGVGLSSYSLTATHAGTIPSNSWVSSGTLSGNITFDLGSAVFIDRFSFWNQNGGGPGAAGSTGIRAVTILTSLDGTNFTPLPGGPTSFAQVAGSSNLPPEIFTFTPVLARDVRFAVSSNYGDTLQTGFAEVMFNSTVPEPSIFALIGFAVTGFLADARKNRNRMPQRRSPSTGRQ